MKKHLGVLCLFAAAFAPFAHAVTVTINYYGTFGSGSWDSSGSENVFGVGTNLTGLPFQLTLTIDASSITESATACGDGLAIYASKASGSNASAITSMTLTAWNSSGVQGNTFTFANNYPLSSAGWEVDRDGPGTYPPANTSGSVDCNNVSYSGFMLSYSETYGGGTYTGTSGVGGPGSWVYTTSAIHSADWRNPVASAASPAAITSADYYGFNIHVVTSGTTTGYAGGYLYPSGASSPFVNGVYVNGFFDTPSGETTELAYSGSWGTGVYATTANWVQQLYSANADNAIVFLGAVREQSSGTTTDGCFANVQTNLGVGHDLFPEVTTAVSGGQWNVSATGVWQLDTVGWVNSSNGGAPPVYLVPWYRSNATPLACNYTGYQQMQYQWADGTWHNYGANDTGGVNTLEAIIDSTTVSSVRAGQTASEVF